MSESQEKHKRMVKRMKYILTEFEVRGCGPSFSPRNYGPSEKRGP